MSGAATSALQRDPAVAAGLQEARAITRASALLVLLALVPALLWLMLAPLTAAVVAPGLVKVDTSRQPIQHLQGGVATQVRVREGQAVRAGETLIVLGDVGVDAERARLLARLNGVSASLARLDAERRSVATLDFPAELIDAARASAELRARLADERALFASHRRSLDEQVVLLRTQQDRLAQEIAALKAQIASSEQALAAQRAELESNRNMQRDGFVSGNRIVQLESGVAEYAAGLEARRGELARAQQRSIENELRQRVLLDEFQQRAGDQHASLGLQLQELQQEYRKALDASERQSITAPVAGVLMGLRIQTPGSLVPARELIAEIVPDTPRLVVEVSVGAQDIGRVAVGQPAEVHFTAFRSPGTPPLRAQVIYVAPDRLPDAPNRGAAYTVHVAADSEALAAARRDGVDPKAGMAAQVFLRGETRSPLAYLVEPVLDILRRSARER
ncbi:Membrane fusion protein (MFP) family protein [Rubrivivax sp. A210]|uniref:HlyD family type I secretion periplasmic adaptor subunit n=1 Tax=Rubrivivax sp. A210 TaxID=2772301 RepID=UPI0019185430|nr:HlyD family type I secretion periplasmic adaptor subunit [Rubrivivax sp. A210]CAD5372616.1 Membrane fusion protein (MFP) family protein [Rubrivivax sp. A210]